MTYEPLNKRGVEPPRDAFFLILLISSSWGEGIRLSLIHNVPLYVPVMSCTINVTSFTHGRSVGWSVGRSVGRSVGWSVSQSVVRSVSQSVYYGH